MLTVQLSLKEKGGLLKGMKFSKPSLMISQQIVGRNADLTTQLKVANGGTKSELGAIATSQVTHFKKL